MVLSCLRAQVWNSPAETSVAVEAFQSWVPVPLVTVQARVSATQVAVSRW